MAGVGTTLYVDFGTSGVYQYASGTLTQVDKRDGEQLFGLGSYLYADFGAKEGLYSYYGEKWTIVSEMDAEGMTGVGKVLYIDFGTSGLYQYVQGSKPTPVKGPEGTTANPEQILGVGSYLYADFGKAGVYRYYSSKWTKINSNDAEGMANVGTVLYLDCGSLGVYRGGTLIDKRNADQLLGVGPDLYADFGLEFGLYRFDGKAWTSVSPMDAEGMAGVGSDLYVGDKGSGVYRNVKGVLANDIDIKADPLQVSRVVNSPIHGTLNLQPDGSFTYTPALNYNGMDSFTYIAIDDEGAESN